MNKIIGLIFIILTMFMAGCNSKTSCCEECLSAFEKDNTGYTEEISCMTFFTFDSNSENKCYHYFVKESQESQSVDGMTTVSDCREIIK